MLGVGVIFGLLSPVSKALLDSGLISPAGLMMTRTAGAAAAFGTASLFVRREPVAYLAPRSLGAAHCLPAFHFFRNVMRCSGQGPYWSSIA